MVLTQDLEFSAILAAAQGRKPSVIQIRSDEVSPDLVGAIVVAVIRQMSEELKEGALVTIEPAVGWAFFRCPL